MREMKQAILESWTEFEIGWGCRPDGYTLHINEDARKRFIKAYNERFNAEPVATHDYSRADNKPQAVLVPNDVFERLKTNVAMWVYSRGALDKLGVVIGVSSDNDQFVPTKMPWDKDES